MNAETEIVSKIVHKYKDDYTIISVFKDNKFADCYLYDLTPFEWACVVGESKLMITTYFHGTLLSLVQGVPVIVGDYSNYNCGGYESKLKDLLSRRLSLDEFYYDMNDIDHMDTNALLSVVDSALSGAYNQRIIDAVNNESCSFENIIRAFDLL